jgi:hypothetical protein
MGVLSGLHSRAFRQQTTLVLSLQRFRFVPVVGQNIVEDPLITGFVEVEFTPDVASNVISLTDP